MDVDGTVTIMTRTHTHAESAPKFIRICTADIYHKALFPLRYSQMTASFLKKKTKKKPRYCCYRTLALMCSDDGTEVKCQWRSPALSND